jgi:hypothetical protein
MDFDFLELQALIQIQVLEESDAIIWLQGDRYDRGPKVLELYDNNLASKIVISGNDLLIGPITRPGENNISLEEMRQWLLNNKVNKDDILMDNNSFNTHDQSINITKLAIKKKWKKIIIVGSFPHYQARYFLTFIKGAITTGWNGKIINQFVVVNDNEKPGGRNETAARLLEKEKDKIKKYSNDLVSVNTGICYLIKNK